MGVIPKNLENTQFARTADENGNRLTPLDPGIAGTDNATDPLADGHGRLIMRVALANGYVTDLNPFPVTVIENPARPRLYTNRNPDGGGVAPESVDGNGHVVFDSGKIVYTISGYSSVSIDTYLLIFDANVLPVDGVTLADYTFPLLAGPNAILPEVLQNPLIYPSAGFTDGLVLAFSSTPILFTQSNVGGVFNVQVTYSNL